MAVKILIKRSLGKGTAQEINPLVMELRKLATQQPGYISGETLKCLDSEGEYLIVSTWQNLNYWKDWLKNSSRNNLQSQIDVLTGEETEYTAYAYLG